MSVIKIENLSFAYDDKLVLENISLEIKEGDYFGLVGPNGSGKSTLLKLILGLLQPKSGTVEILGQDRRSFVDQERIGYVPQKASSFNSGFPATVREIVGLGLLSPKGDWKQGKAGRPTRVRTIHRSQLAENDEALADEDIDCDCGQSSAADVLITHALELVDMLDYEDRLIGELSGGQQQRVFIAKALVKDADILIFDEPTVGVDVQTVASFYKLLRHLHQDHGKTIILVSHDLPGLLAEVDHLAYLNGKVSFLGTRDEFIGREDLVYGGNYVRSHS